MRPGRHVLAASIALALFAWAGVQHVLLAGLRHLELAVELVGLLGVWSVFAWALLRTPRGALRCEGVTMAAASPVPTPAYRDSDDGARTVTLGSTRESRAETALMVATGAILATLALPAAPGALGWVAEISVIVVAALLGVLRERIFLVRILPSRRVVEIGGVPHEIPPGARLLCTRHGGSVQMVVSGTPATELLSSRRFSLEAVARTAEEIARHLAGVDVEVRIPSIAPRLRGPEERREHGIGPAVGGSPGMSERGAYHPMSPPAWLAPRPE